MGVSWSSFSFHYSRRFLVGIFLRCSFPTCVLGNTSRHSHRFLVGISSHWSFPHFHGIPTSSRRASFAEVSRWLRRLKALRRAGTEAGIHLHRSKNVKRVKKKEEASTGEGRKAVTGEMSGVIRLGSIRIFWLSLIGSGIGWSFPGCRSE